MPKPPRLGNYACRTEAIFLESRVENAMDVVVANERTIDPHEINIRDVVHELKELDLTMGKTTDANVTKQPTGFRT